MTVLITLCAVFTALLSAYSLGHYFCAGVFLLGSRPKSRAFGAGPQEPVAILVPAMNEGERALRAVTSLVQQNHEGPIEIYLLLNDRTDTSLPFLKAVYPAAELGGDSPMVELEKTARRTVTVAFTGADPKTHKINWIVRRLTAKYTGILDADHQAEPDWVRTSLVLLEERGARIIQGRRGPISARGFFALWDSLHQHIGCELYNAAFTRLGLTVFFTGTTAILETQLLRDHPLTDCITEDIDFSYTLLLNGVRVIDNPHSGSREETSPNLYSFLARRRRWSAGHTTTFFRHLRHGFASAPLSLKQRVHFLYHGAHYLISVVVFALHLGIGLHFVQALSTTSQIAALAAGLVAGWRIARTQRTSGAVARATEIAVVSGWIFPAIVIAMNLAQAVLINDHSRAALPIPYVLQAVGLIGLLAPVAVLLAGLAGFRQLSAGSLLVVIVTYPLAFYVDITGVLLGMADSVIGQRRWRPVSRAQAALPAGVRAGAVAALLPVRHIKESWSLGTLLGPPARKIPMRLRPSRVVLGSSLLGLFAVGVFYEPSQTIGIAQGRCEALTQDSEPWIVPAKKLTGYCGGGEQTEEGTRTGTFKPVRHDDFTAALDAKYWDRLDTTFFCNLSAFSPENARSTPGEALKLQLEHRASGGKDYSSGSIATKNADDAEFTYGRFEAVLKPAKTSGVLTAFFLYRFDPWQEIDAEFIGQDTSKLLVNVYYNPGEEGDLYNYGMFGTPVLIDLGFDASLDFHRYAIEWEKDEIRWLVDDRLVHVRRAGRPTPIPHLPMRLHASLWPNCSEKLVGPFGPANAPATAELKSVTISNWYPSPLPQFAQRFDGLFSKDEKKNEDWRKNATWIQ